MDEVTRPDDATACKVQPNPFDQVFVLLPLPLLAIQPVQTA